MRRLFVTLAVSLGLVACGDTDQATIDVLAASSYTDIADSLEVLIEAQLGVHVRFSFGSSASFFEQLQQGAPASVVITANAATMERMESANLVEPSVAFSSNSLAIVTADTEEGRKISTLADLSGNDSAILVMCASSAPCGAATDEMLDRAGIAVSAASRETNVRATLTKVLLGEADAAIVYVTDAVAHPELRVVRIPDNVNVAVVSRVAAVAGDETGRLVVAVLQSSAARELLTNAGFGEP